MSNETDILIFEKGDLKEKIIKKRLMNLNDFIKDEKKYEFLYPPINSNMEINVFRAFCIVFINIFFSTKKIEEKYHEFLNEINFKLDNSNLESEDFIPGEIKEINKNNKKQISLDYSEDNFKNIFEYLKKTYKEFYIELLEKILYVPFFLASNLPTEYTYNLYLFDDLQKIKKFGSFVELKEKMFEMELFNKKLSEYFEKEISLKQTDNFKESDLFKQFKINIKPLTELLKLILKEKIQRIKKVLNNFINNFTNINDNQFIEKIIKFGFDKNSLFKDEKNEEKYKEKKYIEGIEKLKIYQNEITILINFIKNNEKKIEEENGDFDIYNEFIYTIFACYSMVNQDSINFNQKIVPFQYDCTLGYINQNNCMCIMDSIKNDSRFKGLKLNNNMFGPVGYNYWPEN
jgi:hypothetical protein